MWNDGDMNNIKGSRSFLVERCVQCPNNTTEDVTHLCMKFYPARDTGLCSDPIPEWCPLPLFIDFEAEESTVALQMKIGMELEKANKRFLQNAAEEKIRELLDAMGYPDAKIRWKPLDE